MRALRKSSRANQGRIRNAAGELESSENRASTLAAYLQDVQWAVRPATLVSTSHLGDALPVNTDPVTEKELLAAIRGFKKGKACGPDDQPVELWRALLENGDVEGVQWLLSFFNRIWAQRQVPEVWHLQTVAMIYKKGDTADCGNYRPICLLNAVYMIFTMVLLRRLLAVGADARVWPSQFGFRRMRGTEDALFCARRAVERAWAHRDGKLHLLALDWAKAFDSISSDALLNALSRFGIPDHVVEIIKSIYTDRKFVVHDCGNESSPHR